MTTQTAFKSLPGVTGWPEQPKPYNKEIHNGLIRYMDQTGASLRDLTKEIQKSRTSISQYINYRYEGDLASFERKIEVFLRKKDPKTVGNGTCETTSFRELYSIYEFSNSEKIMVAGIGESGTGKTFFARKIVRKHPNTTLITADPCKRSITRVVRLIQTNIRSSGEGCTDDILRGIIDNLKESSQFLIFDESHFLSWDGMEIVRAIWDATGIGIMFLAQPRFYIQMRGRNSYRWDQIISRIMIARNLNSITRDDIKLIAYSIHAKLTRSCITYLHEIAQKTGRLRVVTSLLKQAHEISERNKTPLTVDLLKDVRKLMHIWK